MASALPIRGAIWPQRNSWPNCRSRLHRPLRQGDGPAAQLHPGQLVSAAARRRHRVSDAHLAQRRQAGRTGPRRVVLATVVIEEAPRIADEDRAEVIEVIE